MPSNDSTHDMTPVHSRLVRACVAIIVLSTGSGAALAQAERADPASSGAAVRPLEYESAFSNYRAFREPGLRPWQEANKEVAEAARTSSTGEMKHMPGMAPKPGDAPKGSEGGAGHHLAQRVVFWVVAVAAAIMMALPLYAPLFY
jgi:hypothetical protein